MSGRPSPPEKRIANPRPPRRRKVRRHGQAINRNNRYSSGYGPPKIKQSPAQKRKLKRSQQRVAEKIRLLETPLIDALYIENTTFEDSVISVIEKAIKPLQSKKQTTDEKKIEIGQTFWDGIDTLKEQQVSLETIYNATNNQKLKKQQKKWLGYYKEIEMWLVAQGEALHLIRFAEPLTKNEGSVIPTECTICFTDFEMNETGGYLNISKLAKLHCQHVFHKNCLYKWYKEYENRTKKMSCPNCRSEIKNIINGIVHLRF